MAPGRGDHPLQDQEALTRILTAAEAAAESRHHSEFFYRQLVVDVAKHSTLHFQDIGGLDHRDGADVVRAYVRHEVAAGRLASNEIGVKGAGYRVDARVHSCPFVTACKSNLQRAGEVSHCFRAVTLIEAMNKDPQRPLMTYDLAPGLVDETSEQCRIQLRPAGEPTEASPPSLELA
jgi:hypothetical protein